MRVAVLCTALLAGCASMVTRIPNADVTPDIEKRIAGAIKERVRDPDSVQLSKLEGGLSPDGSTLVCGFYNAKNGFGGYAGPTPFAAIFSPGSRNPPLLLWERDGAFLIYGKCQANGMLLNKQAG